MAVLEILHHPDPRLRQKARPVSVFDAALARLIDDMFETMYAAPGVGLAATQVGVAQRVAVMDCAAEGQPPQPMVMINPEIIESSELEEVEEGCLSVPDYRDRVKRYHRLRMRALDRNGQPYELQAEGLAAQAVQHEIDHLDGKLYIDYLSALKRERLKKKLQKEARARKENAA
ncbi:MAG TPA: peptide deformylase [Nevskiaceae bacterium]|nr:peptide deformylase [Nevskiaceae bacterium]